MWYKFSKHALEELQNRNIPIEIAEGILSMPQQVLFEGDNKKIRQSIVVQGEVQYLIRIFIAIDKTPNIVITLYKTSKILKYWKDES